MEINNSFEVPLPLAEAWNVLMDIPRVAPCLPGAEVTGAPDAETYNGKVSVKLGPVALAFTGQVKFAEIDEANHRARAKAQGKDSKGRGGANATVDFRLEPVPGGSRVVVKTDLTLSGAVAQYGRASGLIQDVASQLVGQFADNLKAQLAANASTNNSAKGEGTLPPPSKARPISGFTLLFRALWNSICRLFGKSKT
jgi:carbon monoxide dehydrogenase subunit G